MTPVAQLTPVQLTAVPAVPPSPSWWPAWVPRSVRQFRLKSLTSTFWWLRTWHPWSAFALVALFWVWQHDRRLAHQVRLQQLVFQQVNFRDVEVMLGDFVRPELWIF